MKLQLRDGTALTSGFAQLMVLLQGWRLQHLPKWLGVLHYHHERALRAGSTRATTSEVSLICAGCGSVVKRGEVQRLMVAQGALGRCWRLLCDCSVG